MHVNFKVLMQVYLKIQLKNIIKINIISADFRANAYNFHTLPIPINALLYKLTAIRNFLTLKMKLQILKNTRLN